MILENQTITNRQAVIDELENLQTQISTITPSPTINNYIGESFGGGIIGAIYSYNGTNYALIISAENVSDGKVWSNITASFSSATSTTDGQLNTDNIYNMDGFTDGAAKSCLDYTDGQYTDWYLPSVGEMNEIFKNILQVNIGLESEGTPIGAEHTFWTSTESSNTQDTAYAFGFFNFEVLFTPFYQQKNVNSAVRAIRKIEL